MGVTAVRLLSSLCILVITVQAQNCSRPVGGHNMDLKGKDVLLEKFPNGTKVTFACNPGYVSEGGYPSITCTAGNWSPLRLICARRNCGAAEEVDNGQIEYRTGTEFGDNATLICNTGFMQVGKGKLICGVLGWEGRLPVCEVVKCESPPEIVDGSFSPVRSTYAYNDAIRYTCKRDYELIGTKELACSTNGTFKPDPPKCILVKCAEPEIPNGFWSGGARPPYRFSSTVTLECNPEYTMTGSAMQMCGIHSQWMPGLPKCITQPKPTPPTTTTTTTLSTPRILTEACEDPKRISPQVTVSHRPPYRRSFQVTVSCPSGEKRFTITCQENGLWHPEIPKCKKEDNGTGVVKPLLITLAVIAVLVILGVMYYFGVPPFSKKRKGTRRGNIDKEATKEGEDVALS